MCSIQKVRWRIAHQHLRRHTVAGGGRPILVWHSNFSSTKTALLVRFRRHFNFDMTNMVVKPHYDGYLGLQGTFG